MVTDVWDTIPVRSFASLKVPAGTENVCALNPNNSLVMIGFYCFGFAQTVATADGSFLYYSMDPRVGGELKLSNESRIVPLREEGPPHLMNL